MCTLFIYKKKKSSKWPLLLATNRDEYLSRPFKNPGFHWKEWPNIYGGKDLLKGGSWIGLNDSSVCAIMLNRHNCSNKKYKESRGSLVINALKYKSAKEAIKNMKSKCYTNYNYFNFFITDIDNSYWIKNDLNHFSINVISNGYTMLDNFDLNDSASKKQSLYKKKFLKCTLPIPEKNAFKDWKKLLFSKMKYNNQENTAIYNHDKANNYGTLSSSIIALPNKKIANTNPMWLYHKYSNNNKTFSSLKPFGSNK